MNKTTIKFSLAGLGIVILGVIALYAVRYLNPENRQIREAERIIEELKRQEREDPYGGATPEETLQLFIEALKKGDVELASKYFVWDKQEEWLADLEKIEEKGLLGEMVFDLQRDKERKFDGANATFYIANDKKDLALIIRFVKNIVGKWKIESI